MGHAVRVAVVCEGGGPGAGGCGDSGCAGFEDYADAGALVCSARAQGGGWGDDYVEPQSGGVERCEEQGKLWRVGHTDDHDFDRELSERAAAGCGEEGAHRRGELQSEVHYGAGAVMYFGLKFTSSMRSEEHTSE